MIAYTGWVTNRGNIFIRAADGSRPPEQLTDQPGYRTPQFWTPDGSGIVISTLGVPPNQLDLATLSLSDRSERPLLVTPASESNAALSGDRRFVAYQSDESGRFDIHVRPFPDVDSGHWVISSEGGESPKWSPTGDALYYRSGRRIMAVPVQTTPEFRAGAAKVHVENPLTLENDPRLSFLIQFRSFDFAPDGKRLLILEDVRSMDETATKPGITVLLNWTAEMASSGDPSTRGGARR
jgi:serine/threonine-protein kinase